MNYELDIAFTNDQLNTLWLTNTNVVIAKPSSDGGTPNVSWQVFRPMQANSVIWEEQYGVYASTSGISNGAKLVQLSSTGIPAETQSLYKLQASGAISNPTSGGVQGAFSLLNQYNSATGYMTVGLYQNATVNGTQIAGNAISAAPVLYQSTAQMTPYTTLYIWLASSVASNCVVTNVTSPMTVLKFGGSVQNISIAYDSTTGKFLPVGSSNNLTSSSMHVIDAVL
ncbi:hypothetical protein [Aeromonas veronii]|uniref:hypothetical protein n=1 Tax=Aeromonas veronii TaxID=654 RepID=UPI000B258721|nr:hypothetical protein [Aeromonas veronii]